MITLECHEDAVAPYLEFVSQFRDVMKNEQKQEIPKDLAPKGKALSNSESLKMTLNKSKNRLEVSFYVSTIPEGKRSVIKKSHHLFAKNKTFDYFCRQKLLCCAGLFP